MISMRRVFHVFRMRACATAEFTLEKLLVKNKVEQWRVVVDLEDCSITSAPIGILKQVCDTLTVSYTSFRISEGFSLAFFRAKFFVASTCERTQF